MSRFRALTRNLLPHPRDLTDIFPKIRLHGLHLHRTGRCSALHRVQAEDLHAVRNVP